MASSAPVNARAFRELPGSRRELFEQLDRPDPTLADAILDRLVHNAYQRNLKGESMRKTHGPLNQTDHFTP